MKYNIRKTIFIVLFIIGICILLFAPNKPEIDVNIYTSLIKDETTNYKYEKLINEEKSIIIKTKDDNIELLDEKDNYYFYKDDNKIKVYNSLEDLSYIININSDYERYYFGVSDKTFYGVAYLENDKYTFFDIINNQILYDKLYDDLILLSNDYIEGVLYEEDSSNLKEIKLLSTSEEKELLSVKPDNKDEFIWFCYTNNNYCLYSTNGDDKYIKQVYDSDLNQIYKASNSKVLNDIGSDGNIYVYDNLVFYEYKNGKIIKKNKTYNSLMVIDKYVVTIKDKYIYLMDINGKYTKITNYDNHHKILTYLSSYMDGSIHLVIEEDNVSIKEIYSSCKNHGKCIGISENELKNYSLGYEYIYNTKTNKIDKIGTYIGKY